MTRLSARSAALTLAAITLTACAGPTAKGPRPVDPDKPYLSTKTNRLPKPMYCAFLPSDLQGSCIAKSLDQPDTTECKTLGTVAARVDCIKDSYGPYDAAFLNARFRGEEYRRIKLALDTWIDDTKSCFAAATNDRDGAKCLTIQINT